MLKNTARVAVLTVSVCALASSARATPVTWEFTAKNTSHNVTSWPRNQSADFSVTFEPNSRGVPWDLQGGGTRYADAIQLILVTHPDGTVNSLVGGQIGVIDQGNGISGGIGFQSFPGDGSSFELSFQIPVGDLGVGYPVPSTPPDDYFGRNLSYRPEAGPRAQSSGDNIGEIVASRAFPTAPGDPLIPDLIVPEVPAGAPIDPVPIPIAGFNRVGPNKVTVHEVIACPGGVKPILGYECFGPEIEVFEDRTLGVVLARRPDESVYRPLMLDWRPWGWVVINSILALVDTAFSEDWVDPPTADTFIYQMTGDSRFTEIMAFPPGFSGPFAVAAGGVQLGEFESGPVVFADYASLLGDALQDGGVSEFAVGGIDPFDPYNPTVFPIQLRYSTLTADFLILTATAGGADEPVPEPGTIALFGLAALGFAVWRRLLFVFRR